MRRGGVRARGAAWGAGCEGAHRAKRGGAMRTSRPTAMPHGGVGARRGCAAIIAPVARPCRAPCRGRGAPAGKPRHAKLPACATCQAAHRADGAAARWGHRALPPSHTRGTHGNGARGGRRGRGMPSRAPRWRTPHGQRRGGASREVGEPPRAVAAKHRALSPSRTRGAHGIGTRRWCAAMRHPF